MAQLLHHNELGYSARCPRTRHVYLHFGNVALATDTQEFSQFKASIEALWQRTPRPLDPDHRHLAVRTEAHKLALVFTYHELQQLWELLEMTSLMLEVDQALTGSDDEPPGCQTCPFNG